MLSKFWPYINNILRNGLINESQDSPDAVLGYTMVTLQSSLQRYLEISIFLFGTIALKPWV